MNVCSFYEQTTHYSPYLPLAATVMALMVVATHLAERQLGNG